MSTGAETDRATEVWPQLYARIAGGLTRFWTASK
jgi:hypothetical protein